MEQGGWAQIRLGVPPVARARCAAASTENTLVHPIQLGPIFLGLQNLLPRLLRRVLPLEPRLNALVLIVEIGHIHHQILDHKHVRQRSDGSRRTGLDLRQTRQAVAAVDVHRARAADPFAAAPPEREARVHLVLDLDERVEDHRAAVLEVDLVLLQLGLLRAVGAPPVD